MKLFFIPPALILYCLIVMFSLFIFFPEFNVIPYPFNLCGFIVSIFGFFLMGNVKNLFKKYNTTLEVGKSKRLIQSGIFSKSRNPMYLGMAILVLGFTIVSTNVLALPLAIVFLFIVRVLFIGEEETLLEQTFGAEYIAYKKSVRRWL